MKEKLLRIFEFIVRWLPNPSQIRTALFMKKAGQKINFKPSQVDTETAELRVKLLLEEVLELSEAANVRVSFKNERILKTEQLEIKAISGQQDLKGVADALSDIDYVNYGAANSFGINLEPVNVEVHRSNMSKFIDGYRREDGKWIKGPSYSEANISKAAKLE